MQQSGMPSSPVIAEPHQLTREVFTAQASATKLTNHGRRWKVVYGARFSAFSDEDTAEDALADVHCASVNNALYLNLPEMAGVMENMPALPPAAVLAQYPEVVARFPELGLDAGAQACLAL